MTKQLKIKIQSVYLQEETIPQSGQIRRPAMYKNKKDSKEMSMAVRERQDSKRNILSEVTRSVPKQVAEPPAKCVGSLVSAGRLLQSSLPALAGNEDMRWPSFRHWS